MANRITRTGLASLLTIITEQLSLPTETWTRDGTGKSISNVGALKLDHNPAYGGWSLAEISNEFGGERTLYGRCSASEMSAFLRGWLKGIYGK